MLLLTLLRRSRIPDIYLRPACFMPAMSIVTDYNAKRCSQPRPVVSESRRQDQTLNFLTVFFSNLSNSNFTLIEIY